MTSSQAHWGRVAARGERVVWVCRNFMAFGIGSYAIVWSGLHPCTGVALAVMLMNMGRSRD